MSGDLLSKPEHVRSQNRATAVPSICRFLALVAALPLWICGCARHPSDETLIEFFYRNQTEFQALAETFISDKNLATIWIQGGSLRYRVRDSGSIAPSRVRKYKQYLESLGIRSCTKFPVSKKVRFRVSEEGLGFSTPFSTKGYACPLSPGDRTEFEPVVGSLNGRKRDQGDAYRRIKAGWYLYYAPA